MASEVPTLTNTPQNKPDLIPHIDSKTASVYLWPCTVQYPEDTVVVHSSQEEVSLCLGDIQVSLSEDSVVSLPCTKKHSKNCCCEVF